MKVVDADLDENGSEDEQFYDSDDDGATDLSNSDESEDEIDENLGPADIVWAFYGRI